MIVTLVTLIFLNSLAPTAKGTFARDWLAY